MVGDATLFGNYLFLNVTDDKDYGPVSYTRGVSDFVRYGRHGETIPAVPDEYIQEFKEREWASSEECAPGSRVRITGGVFDHYEAIVKEKKRDRIVVLLTLLNQEQALEFPARQVKAA